MEPDWWTAEESEASFGAAMNPLLSVGTNEVDELPEVVAAGRRGFAPAPEAPMWCFLPVVWPDDHRAWVRDRRARTSVVGWDDGRTQRDHWSATTYAEIEGDINSMLADLGLPPRPPGRIWLLRPPPGCSLDEFLRHVWSSWTSAGNPAMATRELVHHTAVMVAEAF